VEFSALDVHGISPQLHIKPFCRAHFLQQCGRPKVADTALLRPSSAKDVVIFMFLE
jgi:hypothetical protein